jgi:putative copper resistance protein D
VSGFVDVLLRCAALVGQALAVGGVLFVLFVLRDGDGSPATARSLAVTAAGGLGLALARVAALLVELAALADDQRWPWRAFADTVYARAAAIQIGAAGVAAALAWAWRRQRRSAGTSAVLVTLALLVVGASTAMTHAAGRVGGRFALLTVDGVHQLAASAWIGGLAHLMIVGIGDHPRPPRLLPRFSALAIGAVALLVVTGGMLSVAYVGDPLGLIGTAYGAMIVTKVVLLAGLLVLGGANFLAVRRLPAESDAPQARLRRFVEVEVGVGLTALFAAGSLTSLPPAVDVGVDRATASEVVRQFTPKWPRLSSPAIAELPLDDRAAPRTAADRAWSEYNHNVAGLFVLTMGLLACIQTARWGRWARHWPLVFFGLGAFLFVRDDPGAWPLGPAGFWESMWEPAVLQHRAFVLLVVAFGIFEWMVRTGRLRPAPYGLVFPVLCAVGSALLIGHSHALADLKTEYLVEILHTPLALTGMVVAWGRWLELRLPPPQAAGPGRMWRLALTLVGVLLVLYREG